MNASECTDLWGFGSNNYGNSWDKIEKEEGSFAYFSREESKNLDLGYGLLKSQGNNKNNKIDVKNDAKVAIQSKMTKKSPSKAESESKAMASNDSIDNASNMGSVAGNEFVWFGDGISHGSSQLDQSLEPQLKRMRHQMKNQSSSQSISQSPSRLPKSGSDSHVLSHSDSYSYSREPIDDAVNASHLNYVDLFLKSSNTDDDYDDETRETNDIFSTGSRDCPSVRSSLESCILSTSDTANRNANRLCMEIDSNTQTTNIDTAGIFGSSDLRSFGDVCSFITNDENMNLNGEMRYPSGLAAAYESFGLQSGPSGDIQRSSKRPTQGSHIANIDHSSSKKSFVFRPFAINDADSSKSLQQLNNKIFTTNVDNRGVQKNDSKNKTATSTMEETSARETQCPELYNQKFKQPLSNSSGAGLAESLSLYEVARVDNSMRSMYSHGDANAMHVKTIGGGSITIRRKSKSQDFTF